MTACNRRARSALAGLVLATLVVAVIGARPYAGGWNDGSRLAAAESLVDRRTWTIDGSVFVQPYARPPGAPSPYPPTNRLLNERGTLDRLLIDGRYVSDKPPISNLILAADYWLLQRATGLVARDRADLVAYWLTLLSSGLSFVLAAASMFVLTRRVTDSTAAAAALGLALAFATCAAAYSRHVNAHIMLLAVMALLLLQFDRAVRPRGARVTAAVAAASGTLAGLAYGLDSALGPLTLLSTCALFIRIAPARLWLVVLSASPWLIAHHAINYTIAHTFAPPNTIDAYLRWPGSPFEAVPNTGRYGHETPMRAFLYSVDLLAGQRGFIWHNLPLVMVPTAAWQLAKRRRALVEWPVIVVALSLSVSGWLIYALGSTNRSGVALSIRWFLPLLAPLFYVVIVHLQHARADRRPFAALAVFGLVIGLTAWRGGPWQPRVPLFWVWLATGLISYAVLMWQARQTTRL